MKRKPLQLSYEKVKNDQPFFGAPELFSCLQGGASSEALLSAFQPTLAQAKWRQGAIMAIVDSNEKQVVEYKCNSDGQRVRKFATTTGVTDYTLHGKNVVHLTNGPNSLHFCYDAQNRPAVVELNWVPYAYMHNLQGDIITIVDSNGNEIKNHGWAVSQEDYTELGEALLGKSIPQAVNSTVVGLSGYGTMGAIYGY